MHDELVKNLRDKAERKWEAGEIAGCSSAGTAACQHCRNNPMAAEAKPFGNGIEVCPVCGKPSTIGKPITNADRIRAMTDEELAKLLACGWFDVPLFSCPVTNGECNRSKPCDMCFLDWLKARWR